MSNCRNKDMLLFIIYAFGIPLICSILMLKVPLFNSGICNFILYGIVGSSPSLAVLILVFNKGKKVGIKKYFIKKYITNFSILHCVIAFSAPAVVLTAAKIFINMITRNSNFIILPSIKKFIIILWALIAEELGWRGYLQEKLEEKVGMCLTPFIVGCIWTLWHYHFFIVGSMEVPLIAFAYGCIAQSYGYYVMTKISKGNIVPASIWHFSDNLFFNLYLLNSAWNNGSNISYLIINTLYSIFVIIFLVYRKCTIASRENISI